jgi:uncharacterized protein (TIGR02271 family)
MPTSHDPEEPTGTRWRERDLAATPPDAGTVGDDEHMLELREEQLVARKELRELGEVRVRTQVEDVPGRLEVDAYREEVEIEHEPVGQVVSEREQPWEEDGTLVVPIYEEQLVVTKRLILRERLHVRRIGTTERRLFEDTLRRERLVIEDPQHTGLVHEQYPTDEPAGQHPRDTPADGADGSDDPEPTRGGFLEQLVHKALE